MCPKPNIPAATQYQAAKTPVFMDTGAAKKTGRRGTILTGSTGGATEAAPTAKKTLLGM